MKNLKKISALFIAAMLIALSCVTAFATSINGATAQVGDTVTYTLNLANVPSPVAGVQLSIFYDRTYLEPVEDSITCSGFPGYLVNANTEGEIIMNATNGVNGYDFTSKNEMISVTFKVLRDGNTDITYFIYELYDIYEFGPGDYLKTYTITSDISVNGDSVSTDVPPVLNPDRAETGNTSGDFVNNESGIGEVSPEDATPPATEDLPDVTLDLSGGDDIDDLGELNSSDTSTPADETEAGTEGENANGGNTALIIVIAAIVLVLIAAAAAAVIIIRKKSGKK